MMQLACILILLRSIYEMAPSPRKALKLLCRLNINTAGSTLRPTDYESIGLKDSLDRCRVRCLVWDEGR